jgi:hypothetical protein
MYSILQLLGFLLLSSRPVYCVRWAGPSLTLREQVSSTRTGVGQKPTRGPEYDLVKREDSVPASICGWYAGQGYCKHDRVNVTFLRVRLIIARPSS